MQLVFTDVGSFAPKGRARVDPQHPAAFAICDRCGFQYLHRDLRWDMQWRGNKIEKTGFLVCPTCFDTPNPTLRPKVLPPDPVPVLNPRWEGTGVAVTGRSYYSLREDGSYCLRDEQGWPWTREREEGSEILEALSLREDRGVALRDTTSATTVDEELEEP